MNLKGKIIQIINCAGDLTDSFEEKVRKFTSSSDLLEKYIRDILINRRTSINPEFRKEISKVLDFSESDVNKFFANFSSEDYYHFRGLDSPMDRLRSMMDISKLVDLGIVSYQTFRGISKSTLELYSDQYKKACDIVGLDFEYIMTGESDKKVEYKVDREEDLKSKLMSAIKSLNLTPSRFGEIIGRKSGVMDFLSGKMKFSKEFYDYLSNKIDVIENGEIPIDNINKYKYLSKASSLLSEGIIKDISIRTSKISCSWLNDMIETENLEWSIDSSLTYSINISKNKFLTLDTDGYSVYVHLRYLDNMMNEVDKIILSFSTRLLNISSNKSIGMLYEITKSDRESMNKDIKENLRLAENLLNKPSLKPFEP